MNYERVFHRLYPPLFRYLYRLTGDSDVADDAAQEAFVRLTEQRLPEAEVRPWLFRVATNLVRDGARKVERHRRLQPHVPRQAAPEPPDASMVRQERIAAVRATLDRLSERDRTILLMREEGFKYDEIAAAVGVAAGSVGTLLARAARRFEKTYTETGSRESVNDTPR